jgi:hypothetical protein
MANRKERGVVVQIIFCYWRAMAKLGFCFFLLVAFQVPCPQIVAAETHSSGTVPFIFDDNRIFAEIAFLRPDGTSRKAVAFVDIGTPQLVLEQDLGKELGIENAKQTILRVSDLEIEVPASDVQTDTGLGMTGRDGKRSIKVEAVLPGSVMKNYQVALDYAKRSLTMAKPDTIKPTGDAVPCRINPKTGLVSVTAEIGGRDYPLAIDCGSAYTWVRHDVAAQWIAEHRDWERGVGAVGEANMQVRPDGAEARAVNLRLPQIRLGSLLLEQVGALGIERAAPPISPAPDEQLVHGNLFDWFSKKTPEPVIGWIGANVLKNFRVTFDFPRRTIYFERENKVDSYDLSQVGITLETREGQKGYFIAGVAMKDGRLTVDGVIVGDRLVKIDDLDVSGATRGAIFLALHGKLGDTRVLTLERNDKQLKVIAKVTAF